MSPRPSVAHEAVGGLIRPAGPLTAIRNSIVKWHTDVPSDCAKGMPALDRFGRERLARSRKRVVAP